METVQDHLITCDFSVSVNHSNRCSGRFAPFAPTNLLTKRFNSTRTRSTFTKVKTKSQTHNSITGTNKLTQLFINRTNSLRTLDFYINKLRLHSYRYPYPRLPTISRYLGSPFSSNSSSTNNGT